MALVLDATVGGASANSFLLLTEAQDYFDARLPMDGWENADDQELLLVMATRVLEGFANSLKTLVPPRQGQYGYYRVSRRWTGLPATTTQRLSWPRSGMYDVNGNAIPADVLPQELKDATAELAGQLGIADRTLDNDVIVQGLSSVKAGSVALTFREGIVPQVIPDAVLNLLLPGWLTDELIVPAWPAQAEVVS